MTDTNRDQGGRGSQPAIPRAGILSRYLRGDRCRAAFYVIVMPVGFVAPWRTMTGLPFMTAVASSMPSFALDCERDSECRVALAV